MKAETPLGFPISAFPVPQMIHGLSYFLQAGQQSWCFHIVKKRHGDLSHHPETDPRHLCHHRLYLIGHASLEECHLNTEEYRSSQSQLAKLIQNSDPCKHGHECQ